MNSKVFEAYEAAKQRTIQGDFIDRLHSSITTTILFIVLGIVILKQYEGAAILCWTPAQFNEDQILYVHDFCWINSTYYFYQNGKFQVDANKFKQIDKQDIHYYQYIIFILSGQIMLFYLPSVLWKVMASDSRSYINKMLELCEKKSFFKSQIEKQTDDSKSLMSKDFANELKKEYSTLKTNLQKRKNKTQFNQQQQLQQSNSDDIPLKPYKSFEAKAKEFEINNDTNNDDNDYDIENNIKIQEQTTLIADTPKLSKISKLGSMKQRSLIKVLIKPISGAERLSLYYFTFKLLNLFNVIFQLIMLRVIFGHEFYRYGIDFIARFWQTNDAIFISKQFPIMTMCDYYTYQKLGRIHDNATQCLLIINFLIEKFFVVIWFWLIGLLFLTFFNILSWIIEIHTRNNRIGFIYKYLNIKCKMIHNAGLRRHSQTNSVNFSNKDTVSLRHDDVEEFCEKTLGKDGIVMCHILKACAGDIIFLEILNEFWLDFNRKIDD